jgi:hypothetical protein
VMAIVVIWVAIGQGLAGHHVTGAMVWHAGPDAGWLG